MAGEHGAIVKDIVGDLMQFAAADLVGKDGTARAALGSAELRMQELMQKVMARTPQPKQKRAG